jgi:NAD(P)-dependent dehydrogenase (short-subunit alcohol dehydrogenase family)
MDERNLHGANMVFVGGSSGIGLAAATEVARRGAAVLIVGRSRTRGARARDVIRQAGASDVTWLPADVSSVTGVAKAAEAIRAWRPAIHGLVHSAMETNFRRTVTRDGFELAFGLQYLARYALNRALVDHLAASGDGRIVHVGAKVPADVLPDLDDLQFEHRKWTLRSALMSSQVLGYLHAQEAAKRWRARPVTLTIVCVGPTRTSTIAQQPWWVRALYRVIATTPERSARNVVRVLVSSHPGDFNGTVLIDPRRAEPTALRYDPSLAHQTWVLSERLTSEHGLLLGDYEGDERGAGL